jgi:hypothetical protein
MKSEMVCQFSAELSDAIFYPILSGFMQKTDEAIVNTLKKEK